MFLVQHAKKTFDANRFSGVKAGVKVRVKGQCFGANFVLEFFLILDKFFCLLTGMWGSRHPQTALAVVMEFAAARFLPQGSQDPKGMFASGQCSVAAAPLSALRTPVGPVGRILGSDVDCLAFDASIASITAQDSANTF